jgi:copper transport protein
MTMRRLVVLLAVILVAAVQSAAAWAHASLVRTEPADGATLAEPPATLSLVFNEPVSPLIIRLVSPNGETTTAEATAENVTVTVRAGELTRGTHVLSWRVVSADGHPLGGALTFSIGAPSATTGSPQTESDSSVKAAIWIVRLLLYVGLFIGAGGAVFAALIADTRPLPGRVETWLSGMTVCGLVASVLSVGLQGLDALELPLSDLWRSQVWTIGLSTSYALTAITAAAAMILGLAALRWSQGAAVKSIGVAAAAALALALALSGHASTAEPEALSRLSVFFHTACVAFWIGALLPLLAILYRPQGNEGALARFSRLIPFALVALVASGIFLIYVQFDRFDAFWTTDYGLVLSAKISAVVGLLALGAVNRYVLVPRFEAQGGAAARPLGTSFAAELAIAIAILGTVALWRFTPPPRVLAIAEPIPIHLHSPKAMAQVEIEPVRARGANVLVQVSNGELEPLAAKELSFILSNPAAGIEPMRREAVSEGDVTWRIDDLRVPLAGRWHVQVEILINDFEKVTLEDDVQLPRAP